MTIGGFPGLWAELGVLAFKVVAIMVLICCALSVVELLWPGKLPKWMR